MAGIVQADPACLLEFLERLLLDVGELSLLLLGLHVFKSNWNLFQDLHFLDLENVWHAEDRVGEFIEVFQVRRVSFIVQVRRGVQDPLHVLSVDLVLFFGGTYGLFALHADLLGICLLLD